MPHCSQCGTEVSEDDVFCPKCGHELDERFTAVGDDQDDVKDGLPEEGTDLGDSPQKEPSGSTPEDDAEAEQQKDPATDEITDSRMSRRKQLAILGGGVVVLGAGAGAMMTLGGGGNGGGGDGEDGNPAGGGPTPTVTPSLNGRPQLSLVNTLYEWRQYGDVGDKTIPATAPGVPIIVGFRFTADVSGGETQVTEQVTIRGPDGQRVAQKTSDQRALSEQTGENVWEHALVFETRNWDRGTHTAEVIVRDENTDKSSEAQTTEFEVRDPIPAYDVNGLSVDAPDTVTVGESYQFTVELKNTGDSGGGFKSPVSIRMPQTAWRSADFLIRVLLPAHGTNTWQSGSVSFQRTGTLEFRLDDIDYKWEVEIES